MGRAPKCDVGHFSPSPILLYSQKTCRRQYAQLLIVLWLILPTPYVLDSRIHQLNLILGDQTNAVILLCFRQHLRDESSAFLKELATVNRAVQASMQRRDA